MPSQLPDSCPPIRRPFRPRGHIIMSEAMSEVESCWYRLWEVLITGRMEILFAGDTCLVGKVIWISSKGARWRGCMRRTKSRCCKENVLKIAEGEKIWTETWRKSMSAHRGLWDIWMMASSETLSSSQWTIFWPGRKRCAHRAFHSRMAWNSCGNNGQSHGIWFRVF